MEHKEHRRKSKRYPIRWKAAVVFDKAAGKPILHTETYDLSAGGAAVQSEYGDLTGTTINLLLAQPPRQSGEQPKMLKVRARVVSSTQTPGKAGYRHGLSFIPSPNDGLDALEELLKAAGAGAPVAGAPPPAQSPPAAPALPAAAAGSGRLAQLKQMAQAKLTEAQAPDPREEVEQRIGEALKRAYWYWKELAEQLNVVKPAYANKGYVIAGVPEFGGLAWEVGAVDSRVREIKLETKLFTRASLTFHLSAGNKVARAVREFPASEKLKQLLKDYQIEFSTQDVRNERGSIERTSFGFQCKVKASLTLEGNLETGKLLLKMVNVEHFGMMEHVLSPDAITQESLEELTGVILGETGRVGPLLTKNA